MKYRITTEDGHEVARADFDALPITPGSVIVARPAQGDFGIPAHSAEVLSETLGPLIRERGGVLIVLSRHLEFVRLVPVENEP